MFFSRLVIICTMLFTIIFSGCGGTSSAPTSDTDPNQNNHPPVLGDIAPLTVTVGDTVILNPTASDPDGDTLSFSFSGWMNSASYTTRIEDVGTYTVEITVSDGESSDSLNVTITVVEADINNPKQALIQRGELYFNQNEQFNRYYTDDNYQPLRILYVSRQGSNTNVETNSRQDPAPAPTALSNARPGDKIIFLQDDTPYQGCFELDVDHSGTYDNPIVLYGERKDDGTPGVQIECCESGRETCLNIEGADYVAIDGFELIGGRYGVRAVGLNYDSSQHQKGIAVVNTIGHDSCADPFFTGQSDWAVFENNIGYNSGTCDGHGIYLSNGSDWNIVRFNELYNNHSSDFQINADPYSTCFDVGIPYTDPRCDGSAENGQGQGVSEYMHVEGNYFHNGRGQGPNFTSVRNSKLINNIIGPYDRHGTSFWQETDNPELGSSDNLIKDNLFIGETNNRHVLQFAQYSDRNSIEDNIFIGLSIDGNSASPNTDVILIEMDSTVNANSYSYNYYISGKFEGYTPNSNEFRMMDFEPGWFDNFPYNRMGEPSDWALTDTAPFDYFGNWQPVMKAW